MVSPSDSYTHATHKLSEANLAAIAGLQNMDIPPAYSANANIEDDSSSDSDASDLHWTGPPVTVHIDASLTIEGTGNQIALPPHPNSRPLRVIGHDLRAAQGLPQDYLQERSMRDRAEQICDAVLQALKDAGVLAGAVTPQRQLDVHVDASLCVKGERNVVTTNVPVRRMGTGDGSSPVRGTLENRLGRLGEGSAFSPGMQAGNSGDAGVADAIEAPVTVGGTLKGADFNTGAERVPETADTKRARTSSVEGDNDQTRNQKRAKI